MRRRSILYLVGFHAALLLAMVSGCASTSEAEKSASRQRAITTATEAWFKDLPKDTEHEIDVINMENGNWLVTITKLSGTPRVHTGYEITPDGRKIVHVIGGV